MYNADFTNFSQTTYFHTQDSFQIVFLTRFKHNKEWFAWFSWDFKVSEMQERELDSCFYNCSINRRATSNYQDNMSLVSTIFKSFTNHTPRLHFWTQKNTKIFDSYKNLDYNPLRITLTCLESHQEHNRRHKKYKTLWWLSLSNHTWVLQAFTKLKCI